MHAITIFEHQAISPDAVPRETYDWLKKCCFESSAAEAPWIRATPRGGLQVTNYVGVIRAAGGVQFEVLPKIGMMTNNVVEARHLLLEMLSCLREFRHVRTPNAQLLAKRLPLWEVFIAEFLGTVTRVVKHGLRGAYELREKNLLALRGKLLIGNHLRANLFRRDRFFIRHDEFSRNRPENRLLHSALRVALSQTRSAANQRLGRELEFAFAEIPPSSAVTADVLSVRLERGMDYYEPAIAWAKLLLARSSPLTGDGENEAPSLLFPMELVFEAFVAEHLGAQLAAGMKLAVQVQRHSLVTHDGRDWFRMKPDLVIQRSGATLMVLDTKWKLISHAARRDKYGLSQADLYQLFAYGQSYLDGRGDMALIYPATSDFTQPLECFEFPRAKGLRLWVLPFDLRTHRLIVPPEAPFVGPIISATA